MIIVTGNVRFGEGEIDRLRKALIDNIEETRAEPGCDHYSYAIDLTDPNLLHVSERWRDEASIDTHMASPHMAELMAEIGQAKIEALSVKAWQASYLRTLLGT